jgi:GH25 family lysozyme M1 (1,4-beta-N-acetylmuramidase)
MSLKYTLKNGDSGQEVARLQRALKITSDGKFGPKTEATVKDYQEEQNLVVDGLAGKRTLTSLKINVTAATDLSSWNGTVDFESMKKAGVSAAWIKLTEGTTHRNPGREKKFEDARTAGFDVGAYHFGRPDTYTGDPLDWEKEANNFLIQLEKVGCHSGDLIPVLDLEAGMKTDDNHNVNWCLKWLDHVGKETQSTPMVYTARWAWQLFVMKADKANIKKLLEYPVWYAAYIRKKRLVGPEEKLRGWTEWDVWQYTGHGELDGVKGRVDLNWIAGEQYEKMKIS